MGQSRETLVNFLCIYIKMEETLSFCCRCLNITHRDKMELSRIYLDRIENQKPRTLKKMAVLNMMDSEVPEGFSSTPLSLHVTRGCGKSWGDAGLSTTMAAHNCDCAMAHNVELQFPMSLTGYLHHMSQWVFSLCTVSHIPHRINFKDWALCTFSLTS